MDLLSFFQRLNKQGVKLVLKDGSLSVKSNKRVDQQLLLEIKSNKASIIEYLKKYQSDNANELQEKYQQKTANRVSLENIKPFDKKSIEKIPLSFNQDRLWFLDQFEGTVTYHLPTVIRLEGALNIDALEKSLKTIVARHEVLRTNLIADEGIGYQNIINEENWSLDQEKISEEETLKTALHDYINIPFDLSNDYKLRACLYDLGNQKYVVACVFHHIASDGWSSNILINEFVELYSSLSQQRKAELPALTLQYSDYALWQRTNIEGEVLNKQLAYWEEKLKETSTLVLPTDYVRPAVQSSNGSYISVNLDENLSSSLKAICQKEGVTLFMLLLSAFKTLLFRYSGQNDICVGTPIANRTQSELEGMIGFFVNTLALRSDVSEDLSFKQLLNQIKQTTLQAYDHQLVPFEKIVDKVVKTRNTSTSPLFQVMFVLQNTPSNSKIEIEDVEISVLEAERTTAKFDLTMHVSEEDLGISLGLEYCTALFNKDTIDRMLTHYKELLRSIANNIDHSIGELSMLTSVEKTQLTVDFNNTTLAYPTKKTIVTVFEEQAEKTPHAVAVTFEKTSLTYQELNKRSNQVAHYLRDHRVEPDMLVGICMDRSLELLVGILGVLKSGGAYVPIDPDYPADRIDFMLEDANINLVLSTTANSEVLSDKKEIIPVALDSDWDTLFASYSEDSLAQVISPNNLAYVMYTSGSTGTPKGVQVEHKNVVSLATSCDYVSLDSNTVWLSTGSVSFDAVTIEYWGTLLNGGELILTNRDVLLNTSNLKSLILEKRVNTLWMTASWFHQVVEEDVSMFASLQYLLVGGDVVLFNHTNRLKELYPDVTIINGYGPTENTTFSTTYTINITEDALPIGAPIKNSCAYITDSSMNLVPVGVIGELLVGGSGVARGYLNNRELTNEKFINSPFVAGDRLYKTGDLARWMPDGNIEFIGRKDHQIKISGYRIELGEIENTLSNVPSITQSCVLVKDGINGNKRLVGYVVTEGAFDKEAIQAKLKESLPDYMIPNLWVELTTLPLTSNGKLDRKSLPDPDISDLSTAEYVAPRNEKEQQIVTIWQELLGIEKIGVYDDFFELGGHSLLVVQLISKLQAVGFHVTVKDIFSNSTIAAISKKISLETTAYKVPVNGITVGIDRIIPKMIPLLDFSQEDIDKVVAKIPNGIANIQDMYPLSPLQEGMYFHYLMSDKEQGDPYVLSNLLSFTDTTKRASFIEALQFVVNRHDVLRTCVISEDLPSPVQVVLREAFLSVDHLEIDASKNVLSELQLITTSGKQWMDVSKAPLFTLQTADDEIQGNYYLLLNQHHLIFDHVGLEKIITEIELYISGKETSLPDPVLYRDFIGHTLHLQATNDSATYFKELLSAIDTPTYPFELSDIQGNGSAIQESHIVLPEELSKEIRKASITLGISPAVLFHAAFGVVVGRCSNKPYALFGTLLSGRLQGTSGAADSLGLFINTLPFFTELTGSVLDYISTVRKTLGDLLSHEQTPLSKVQSWSRISNEQPLFSALLNFRHSHVGTEEEIKASVDLGVTLLEGFERTNYPFSIDVDDYGVDFGLKAQIDGSINADKVLSYMEEAITALLTGLKNEVSVASVNILPEEEKVHLLEEFNNTKVAYPSNKTILDVFEKQVVKTPDAPAVVFEGAVLSYQELDQRSNQLAHYLIAKGTQPEDVIGICLGRSLEMLVGILGILKSGAAYVPVDTSYPKDRINYMIDDSGVRFVVSDAKSINILPSKSNLEIVLLDQQWSTISKESVEKPTILVSDAHLAYVIYTSGSTGKPKGVMVTHASLIDYVLTFSNYFEVTNSDTILSQSTISFDTSVEEIFPILISGGTLVIAENNKDFHSILSLCEKHAVTLLSTNPYLVAFLNTQPNIEALSLRAIISGGDIIKPSYIDNIYNKIAIYNTYGPTEATVCVSYFKVENVVTSISIGKPIANTSLYVVDDFGNLCPEGVIGELWASGVGVAKGYLNRPELTKEKFITNPFEFGTRIYKTGDLVKWLPDGHLEFIGRKDHQVSIRGYRIELGEIENALLSLTSIDQCCVLSKEDTKGNVRLVGYVVADGIFNKEKIQEELSKSLPDYMIPMIWIVLEEMPLTTNGKLDKKALPEPDESLLSSKPYVAPRNETEIQLAAIWEELLGVEKIGIYDNFFELGGHSLLVVQLISRLQEANFNIAVKDVFSNPTISAVSEKLSSTVSMYQVPENGIQENTDFITPSMIPLLDFKQEEINHVVANIPGGVSNIQDMYPLSPLQEGIYFHYLMRNKDQGDPYALPHLLSFKDQEKRNAFVKALQFVVNRHDVLRTCILSEGLPQPVQVVLREALLHIEYLELDDAKDVLSQLEPLRVPGNQWIDVTKAPLLTLQSADDSKNGVYYLILLEHHLIMDHVGMEKVVAEINWYLSDQESNLPTPVLYRDFIGHTLHLQAINDSESYFKKLLGTIDVPTYPFELSDVKGDIGVVKESKIILPAELSQSIRNASVRLGISPAVVFHAAYGIVIGRCSNTDYALFGTLLSGRLQGSLGAADSLGLFINTLPFFIAFKGSVLEYIKEVKQRLTELLPYEQTPLSNIQGWSGISNEVPLFSALLNFRHTSMSSEEDVDTDEDLGIEVLSSEERTNYPFTVNVDDYGVDFGITAQIDESIEADRVLDYIEQTLAELVDCLNDEASVPVTNLKILSTAEETQLLEGFNATVVNYPQDQTILDLFNSQVFTSPESIAVVYKGEELSYATLDKRSNQLAHFLQKEGVVTDTLVGICIDRSLEMIIGMLGILKSGGAYVPIDPSYPKDRINYIIEDTAIKLIVSTANSRSILEDKKDIITIALDSDWHQISEFPAHNLSYKSISQNNLAYVIYTSGSTGRPKGVMIEHGNMFNLVNWAISNFEESLELGMLASTSINFDLSIFEIFTSLASGSKIELVDNLLSLVEDSEVSVSLINTVPSVLLGVLESGKLPETVKTVNLAGEPLLPSVVDRIYAESSIESVYDLYGPSEATTYSTFIKREFNGIQTIGRPIANTQAYILNESNALLPVGVVGELCLGGKGVARGYLNRPELTSEKFIENVFKEGDRIYKTGDLARWLPDGTLEYVGRKDSQVKVRGYRIELGEIETALLAIGGIQQGCVLAAEDALGIKRLIGYVVGEFDKDKTQEILRESLPEYMVPTLWIELDEMPLTASGKLDRKALPAPDGSILSTKIYVAPRNEIEEKLVKIWQKLLGIEKIGVYDNFFELGGHSLLATRLVSTVSKELEVEIMIKDIFNFVSIDELSTYLEHKKIKEKESKETVYKKIIKI
ncbi:non-ribosomal peptide synthetase [Tenacibaculum agarivorans]|uniref:non-ribosomal peptide synthetase n=1 Tax=Tenacibaculum agarivorans TaxID=1908389 RepID=UPI00094B89BA|nr:non-ribosomal peptide synthetase [Tenacibaculum agarivorans]